MSAETGPGKYDDACTAARALCKAHSVVLIVFGGHDGDGFSVQAIPNIVINMPHILRRLADDIEKLQATHKNQ